MAWQAFLGMERPTGKRRTDAPARSIPGYGHGRSVHALARGIANGIPGQRMVRSDQCRGRFSRTDGPRSIPVRRRPLAFRLGRWYGYAGQSAPAHEFRGIVHYAGGRFQVGQRFHTRGFRVQARRDKLFQSQTHLPRYPGKRIRGYDSPQVPAPHTQRD